MGFISSITFVFELHNFVHVILCIASEKLILLNNKLWIRIKRIQLLNRFLSMLRQRLTRGQQILKFLTLLQIILLLRITSSLSHPRGILQISSTSILKLTHQILNLFLQLLLSWVVFSWLCRHWKIVRANANCCRWWLCLNRVIGFFIIFEIIDIHLIHCVQGILGWLWQWFDFGLGVMVLRHFWLFSHTNNYLSRRILLHLWLWNILWFNKNHFFKEFLNWFEI